MGRLAPNLSSQARKKTKSPNTRLSGTNLGAMAKKKKAALALANNARTNTIASPHWVPPTEQNSSASLEP